MNRSNRLARQQSEIQENVVLAKTIIEGKIRKATYVTIGSTEETLRHFRGRNDHLDVSTARGSFTLKRKANPARCWQGWRKVTA